MRRLLRCNLPFLQRNVGICAPSIHLKEMPVFRESEMQCNPFRGHHPEEDDTWTNYVPDGECPKPPPLIGVDQ